MSTPATLAALVLTLLTIPMLAAQDASSTAWQRIAQAFKPPAQYENQFGEFRSPLIMANGQKVTTAAQWSQRRLELLDTWHKFMGPWPKVIEHPKFEVVSSEIREGIAQKKIRIEIAENQIADGWLLVPPGDGPKPAALVVFYDPETSIGLKSDKPGRDFGWQLSKRGLVTLNIGTPGGNAYKPEIGQALCQPLSFHAYVAANCWQAMADLPEIDDARIGIVGHSYGGKWSMFGGALWDKFAAVATSDPGIVFDDSRGNINYWEPWYLGLDPSQKARKPGLPTAANPTAGAYRELRAAGHDLHELHALICPRPFFVSGGSEDPATRWLALNHSIAVNQVLGVKDRVGMTNRPDHSPTAESNAALVDFFVHFLVDQPVKSAGSSTAETKR